LSNDEMLKDDGVMTLVDSVNKVRRIDGFCTNGTRLLPFLEWLLLTRKGPTTFKAQEVGERKNEVGSTDTEKHS
jgi:hypothetical protein